MSRVNNFDFLRLLLSIFVIITHSYPLTGVSECDWLCSITDRQLSFSGIGVHGFFIISGYLIYMSMERSKGVLDYFQKRFLRLFPALLVVLVLTVVLVPFVYESDIPFLNNPSVRSYVLNNLTLYNIQFTISGVFENNPFPGSVNGSLWTIAYEFSLYIIIAVLMFVPVRKWVVSIVFLILVVLNVKYLSSVPNSSWRAINSIDLIKLGALFFSGSVLAAFKFSTWSNRNTIIIVGSLLLVLAIWFNLYSEVKLLLLPLLIVGFGISSTPIINKVGDKIGDLSYGIYIYAFPIQQSLYYFFELDLYTMMVFTIVISAFFAYASWHLIEKRALLYKDFNVFDEALKLYKGILSK